MARKPKAQQRTLGALADDLWDAREEKRAKAEEMKAIEARIEGFQSELIERLEKEGLDSIKGSKASLTVTPTTIPQITDWDAFLAWTARTKNFQTIRRQINPEPWRELMETRKDGVPGTEPFVKKTLNMRTL